MGNVYRTAMAVAEGAVHYMEIDEADPDSSILFLENGGLKTTNGYSIVTDIAGKTGEQGHSNQGTGTSTRFNWPRGFVQLDQNYVIVADTHNKCLRIVNRQYSSVTDYAGKCINSYGTEDGTLEEARFSSRPWHIIKDKRDSNKLLLTEDDWSESLQIRVIDRAAKTVKTLVLGKIHKNVQGFQCRSLLWDPQSDDRMFVTCDARVLSYQFSTDTLTVVVGLAIGEADLGEKPVDGAFPSTATIGGAGSMIAFVGNLFLITSHRGNRVRVLDMENRQISSICIKSGYEAEFIPGSIAECRFASFVYSVVILNSAIYIGDMAGMRKVPFQLQGKFRY